MQCLCRDCDCVLDMHHVMVELAHFQAQAPRSDDRAGSSSSLSAPSTVRVAPFKDLMLASDDHPQNPSLLAGEPFVPPAPFPGTVSTCLLYAVMMSAVCCMLDAGCWMLCSVCEELSC